MDAATKKWNGEMKEAARSLAVRSDKKNPAKVYLGLPGSGCKCVREALKQGTIDADTFVIAVERDPETADLIETQLNGLVKDYHLHRDTITTLNIDTVLQDRKVDFAFLDFCGSLYNELAQWLVDQRHIFTDDAQVAFTFSICPRASSFMNKAKAIFKWFFTLDMCEFKMLAKSVDKQLRRKARFIYGSDNGYRFATVASAYAILSLGYHVEITNCDEYCDTSPMIMVKFRISDNEVTINRHLYMIRYLRTCDLWINFDDPKERNKKRIQKQTVKITSDMASWQQLGCPEDMTSGNKSATVRRALQGIRPPWMKPAVWAWHPMNPNGIRRKKSA